MEQDAYRQYDQESRNWLHRGRLRLIERLLREATGGRQVGRLLEVGAGVGQNLPAIAQFGPTDAAEIDQLGRERIRALGVVGDLYTDRIPFDLRHSYDVICAFDVVEHLEDDIGAVKWMVSGLAPGGHLIVSVPAFQWLFSDHDRALGHYRRYTKHSLAAVVPDDVEIVRVGYFNTALFPVAVLARAVHGARKRFGSSNRPVAKQRSTVPGPVDAAWGHVLAAEAAAFVRKPVMPFGLSVFMLARARR